MRLRSREKILIVFVFIAIAIWGFDRFYYKPQNRKILQFKGEIRAADQKMEQFLLLTKGVQTVESEVTRLEKELTRFSEQTLKGDEFRAFLRHLARESKALPMEIISVASQEEKPLLPEGKKETTASQYRKVTIQMVLHSTYTNLGHYLKDTEKLPFLVNIDSLQIERKEEISPFFKVTMGLRLHIH